MTARSLRVAAFPILSLAAACALADEPAAGQVLYNKHCLTCHQADGGGVPNMQPAIAGGSWVKGDARALALFVMSGGFDSASRKDSDVGNVMPPFRQLADADIAAILTFIRQKFGDGSAPVSAADVAEARTSLPSSPRGG
jgi:mono/diheme cytochrome c family protein